MPHLSKRKLNTKIEEEILNSLIYVLSHSNDLELKQILSSLMTRTERLMIAKRLGVASLIKDQVPVSTIDEAIKVTRFTVSKVELLMSNNPEGFMIAFEKIGQRKVKNQLKQLLVGFAEYAIPASTGFLPRKK